MLRVFNDANRLTLTPHSFPSRIVAEMLSTNFDIINNQKSINTCDLQYLNPTAYRELLASIVETDKAAFCDKLMKSSAIPMRCAVDRTQIDKIFVMTKVVHYGGAENLYFLRVDECPQRGAKGLLMAVRNACINTVSEPVFNKLLLKYHLSLQTELIATQERRMGCEPWLNGCVKS